MINVSNKFPDTTYQSNRSGIHHPSPMYFFLERYREAYREEMKSFLDAILFKREPEVTGADGRLPVAMAHAAMLSLSENRPVRLAEIG
jgi:myo-inositol 2-dehydrogenase/D-chiro-inositol 1-dehydrogenase